MDKKGKRAWLFMSVLGFGLGAMNSLRAAPPLLPKSTAHFETQSQRLENQPSRLETQPHPEAQPPHPLDLHLPAAMTLDTDKGSSAFTTSASAAFPTALHRAMFRGLNAELPQLGSTDGRQVPGRVEEFAQRVRREGLPIARLWQNNAAVVSLGLNPKGKPGLWLVQKVH